MPDIKFSEHFKLELKLKFGRVLQMAQLVSECIKLFMYIVCAYTYTRTLVFYSFHSSVVIVSLTVVVNVNVNVNVIGA